VNAAKNSTGINERVWQHESGKPFAQDALRSIFSHITTYETLSDFPGFDSGGVSLRRDDRQLSGL
jgi:hypothetical protein